MLKSYDVYKEWIIENRFGEERRIIGELPFTMLLREVYTDRVDDMITVLSEACLNAIEHGNGMNPDTHVRVVMMINNQEVLFRIYDTGLGFDYHPINKDELMAGNELPYRGWGLFLINQLSDHVTTGFEDEQFFIEIYFKCKGGVEDGRAGI